MEGETLTFMPNGDVTLQLVRRIGQQSPSLIKKPPQENENATAEEEEDAAEEDDTLFFAPDPPETEHTASVYFPPVRGRRDSGASSVRERSTSPPPGFWARLRKEPVVIIAEDQDVKCVISSGHMMLASAYFQRRLSGDFHDAVTLKKTGRATITLDDDPDTLIVLLNIIHGRTRQVPRKVTLDLLSRLAVLINYYGMLESVELFSDTWIDNLKREGMPETYNEKVFPWLFIFWVFEKGDDFKDMARLVQRECDDKLDSLVGTVPLPHTMINAMKNGRQIAIDTAITAIDQLITKYMDGKVNCSHDSDESRRYACDAMVLGSLIKGARTLGIWPKPTAPFSGKRLAKILEEIRSIKVLDVCTGQTKSFSASSQASNCHGIEDSIKSTMKIIEDGLEDLELGDYRKNNELLWDEFPTSPPIPAIEEDEKEVLVTETINDQGPSKQPEESEPKLFRAEDVFEDDSDVDFGSVAEIERRFSDTSSEADPRDDLKAEPFTKESVPEEDDFTQQNSYMIPRKDVIPRTLEREVPPEEIKEPYPAMQAQYAKYTPMELPESRPVLEESRQNFEVKPSVTSANRQSPTRDFAESRPTLNEIKVNRPAQQVSKTLQREDIRSDSLSRRSPVVQDVRQGHESAARSPVRHHEPVRSPREHLIVETKRDLEPEQPQKVPSHKQANGESAIERAAGREITSEQAQRVNPHKPKNVESPRGGPMVENFNHKSLPEQVQKATLPPKRTTESPRGRNTIEEIKRSFTPERSQGSPFPKQSNAEPARSTALDEVKGNAPIKQSPTSNAQSLSKSDSFRKNSVLDDTKEESNISQPWNASRNEVKPGPSNPGSPVFQVAKKVYAFEQDISEPLVEGVKVTDNWRGSSILEDPKTAVEEVKTSPKSDVQVTTNSISAGEDNDLFIPPATFKVRKSKKRFATRF